MDESSLTKIFLPSTKDFINHQANVTYSITPNKHWNLSKLKDILPSSIIEKTLLVPIPVNVLRIRLF